MSAGGTGRAPLVEGGLPRNVIEPAAAITRAIAELFGSWPPAAMSQVARGDARHQHSVLCGVAIYIHEAMRQTNAEQLYGATWNAKADWLEFLREHRRKLNPSTQQAVVALLEEIPDDPIQAVLNAGVVNETVYLGSVKHYELIPPVGEFARWWFQQWLQADTTGQRTPATILRELIAADQARVS